MVQTAGDGKKWIKIKSGIMGRVTTVVPEVWMAKWKRWNGKGKTGEG